MERWIADDNGGGVRVDSFFLLQWREMKIFALESRQRRKRLKAETDTFVFNTILLLCISWLSIPWKKLYLEVGERLLFAFLITGWWCNTENKSGGKCWCLHHCFQRYVFLPIQTKVQHWIFQTKTGTAVFPKVSILGALKCWSSVGARPKGSKRNAFQNENTVPYLNGICLLHKHAHKI